MEGAVELRVQYPSPCPATAAATTDDAAAARAGTDDEGGVTVALLFCVVERVGGRVDRVRRWQICGMWTGGGGGSDGLG